MKQFVKLCVCILLYCVGFSNVNGQSKGYEIVTDTGSFYIHLTGNLFQAEPWVTNMNTGAGLGLQLGLNKRLSFSGNYYWAAYYDQVFNDYTNNNQASFMQPSKALSPMTMWDVGTSFNFKTSAVKSSVRIPISSRKEKFLGQVIAVQTKSVYIPGTIRSSKAFTFRMEHYSTPLNLSKSAPDREYRAEYGDSTISNVSTGFNQMQATSFYFGFRSTRMETRLLAKTDYGKLKNFGKVSYYFEYCPIAFIGYGNMDFVGQEWEIKGGNAIARGWRAGIDAFISSKRSTATVGFAMGARPGHRRLFLQGKFGILLYSYVKKQ